MHYIIPGNLNVVRDEIAFFKVQYKRNTIKKIQCKTFEYAATTIQLFRRTFCIVRQQGLLYYTNPWM